MRPLGQALDRKVMTLYRYVPSKDALLDGVVARVHTGLAINPAAADLRRNCATSPPPSGASRSLTPTRYAAGHPAASQPPRATATTHLAAAGRLPSNCSSAPVQPRRRTARLPAVLRIPERTRPRRAAGPYRHPDEADDLLRLGLHRLPRREFPRIRALAPELASYDGAAHLQQGVEMMITGLQSRFQPARTRPAT